MSTPTRVDYQTDPSRYRHWQLKFDGAIATLGLDIDEQLKGATDFLVFGHRMEFVGLCPHCQPAPAVPSCLPNVDKPKPAP